MFIRIRLHGKAASCKAIDPFIRRRYTIVFLYAVSETFNRLYSDSNTFQQHPVSGLFRGVHPKVSGIGLNHIVGLTRQYSRQDD
jgi:hypothetical protein